MHPGGGPETLRLRSNSQMSPMSITDPFRRNPRFLARLPRIVRLYIFNCLIGFTLSGIFTAAILYWNVAGIGHLVAAVPEGKLALLVFFMLNGIVFSGVQTGVVIMSMDYDDDDSNRGTRVPVLEPALVPVPAARPQDQLKRPRR